MGLTRIHSTADTVVDNKLFHIVEVRRRETDGSIWAAPEAWLSAYDGEGIYASYQLAFVPERGMSDPFSHPFMFFFADADVALAFKLRWG